MTSFQVAQWLRQGIAAARTGDVDRACELLLKVVDIDEYNEQAWLWLSSVVESDEDRKVCLENVLAINPDNKLAKAGLVHLRNRTTQPSPLAEAEPQAPPESPPQPAAAPEGPASSDWWDQPETLQTSVLSIEAREQGAPAAAAPTVDSLVPEVERERPEPKRKRRHVRVSIRRFAVPVLFVLGLLAAGLAVAAFLQTDLRDPAKRDYADAMRAILDAHDAWWEGPQGALIAKVNSSCGPGADGWRNQDVLRTCNAYPTLDCSLLAAHCGVDIKAMRKQVERLAKEAQESGRDILVALEAVSPVTEIATAHARFSSCIEARLNDAERIGRLARGEPVTDQVTPSVCQVFSSAETEVQVFVGSH